jgi:hypothetical protein
MVAPISFPTNIDITLLTPQLIAVKGNKTMLTILSFSSSLLLIHNPPFPRVVHNVETESIMPYVDSMAD